MICCDKCKKETETSRDDGSAFSFYTDVEMIAVPMFPDIVNEKDRNGVTFIERRFELCDTCENDLKEILISTLKQFLGE